VTGWGGRKPGARLTSGLWASGAAAQAARALPDRRRHTQGSLRFLRLKEETSHGLGLGLPQKTQKGPVLDPGPSHPGQPAWQK